MRLTVEIGKRYMHIETGPVVAVEPEPLTVTETADESEHHHITLSPGFQAPPDDEREPQW